MSYKKGDWYVYCDICGQRSLASQSTKLSTYTGHGSNVVCRHDVDRVDLGLLPFSPRREKNLPWARTGHTNTDNGSPIVDLESMTYQWYLAASQDNAILMTSQDDAWIIAQEPF